jgi:hypothetical protein
VPHISNCKVDQQVPNDGRDRIGIKTVTYGKIFICYIQTILARALAANVNTSFRGHPNTEWLIGIVEGICIMLSKVKEILGAQALFIPLVSLTSMPGRTREGLKLCSSLQ